MEFSIKSLAPEQYAGSCLVVGVFAGSEFTPTAALVDSLSGGLLAEVVKRGDLDDKAGDTLLLQKVPGTLCERVLMVSLGKREDFADKPFRSAIASAVRSIKGTGAKDALLALDGALPKDRDVRWAARQAVMTSGDVCYRYDHTLSSKDEKPGSLASISLLVTTNDAAAAQAGCQEGQAVAEGVALAKELGNLPGNLCTPSYLAEQARKLGVALDIKVEVLERADVEQLGMGAFVAVAKGSHEPCKFIVMDYQSPAASGKPIVLVGKGITFDSGGISLKPGADMDEMKFDMCGAASVLGTFEAVARMKLPVRLVGLIPATENMPGGGANKPGDVLTSMSGQTIEVLNTDAEGRLILCDALTYAERFDPDCVVDIATLTGACVVALGSHPTGLLANDDALAQEFLARGQESGDRCWQLPLWDDYQDQLKSNFADMANIGGREAGAITAACFLSRFTKKYKWAHLDIAGPAWNSSGDKKGSTGRPVPLLTHFIMGRCEQA